MRPNVGADAGLVAVDARSRREAWAVGYRTVSRFLRPVAMRWTGARWAAASPSWRAGGSATLTDVATGRGVWAVGYRTSGSGLKPYVVFRRGSGWVWRLIRTLGLLGSARRRRPVKLSPGRGTWAAGWQSDRTGIRPLLLRWTGSSWAAPGAAGRVRGGDGARRALRRARAASGPIGYRVADGSMAPVLFRRGAEGWRRVDAADSDSASMLPDGMLLARGVAAPGRGPRGLGQARTWPLPSRESLDGSVAVTPRPAGIRGSSHLRAAVSRRWSPRSRSAGRTAWVDSLIRRCAASAGADGCARPAPRAGSGSRRLRIWCDHPRARRRAPADTHRGPARLGAAGRGRVQSRRRARPRPPSVRFRGPSRRVAGSRPPGRVTPTYGGVGRRLLDGDGWDDLVISRHQSPARVLLNRRGRVPARRRAIRCASLDRHGCRRRRHRRGRRRRRIHLRGRGVARRASSRRTTSSSRPWTSGHGTPRGSTASPTRSAAADGPPSSRWTTNRALELLVTNEVLRVDGLPDGQPALSERRRSGPASHERPRPRPPGRGCVCTFRGVCQWAGKFPRS